MCFCMLPPFSHSQKLHDARCFISPPVFCPSSSALPLPPSPLFVSQMLYVALICSSSMWIIHVVDMPLCSQSRSNRGMSGEENSDKWKCRAWNMRLTCCGGSSRGHALGGGQGTGGRFPGPNGRRKCETGHGNGRGNYLPRSTHVWCCGRDRRTNWEGRTG